MRDLHVRFALEAIEDIDYLARLGDRHAALGGYLTKRTANAVWWALRLAGASHGLADKHAPLIAEMFAERAAPYVRVASGNAPREVPVTAGCTAAREAAYAALFADLAGEGVA